ncbi:MAG: hypothetical protein V4603_12400 [Pseudomonadota bacterium]
MSEARGFVGKGDVYINRIENGVALGLAGPYYANKFEVKPKVKKLELTSKGKKTYGQVLETVSVQEPAEFTLELSEVNKESMVLALLGTTAAVTQTGGTLTAEAIIAKLGKWVPLSKGSLTGVQTVTHTSGSPTYTLGTDYEVNEALGWIKAIDGGAIDADESIKVTSTYGAYTGTLIAGSTKTDIRAQIIFDGENQADGLPCIVTIHEAIIAADAAFDFLADNFNKVNLPGSMKTPTNKHEPFTVEMRSA